MVWSICAKVLMGEISSALFLLQEVRQLSDAPFLPLSFLFLLPLGKKAKRKNQRKRERYTSIIYLLSNPILSILSPMKIKTAPQCGRRQLKGASSV